MERKNKKFPPENTFEGRKHLESIMQNSLADLIRKKAAKIPSEKNLTKQEFQNKYVKNNRPVVLKSLMCENAVFKKWDFDFFANNYPKVKINVNLYDAKNTKSSNIKSLIDSIKSSNELEPTYLQEWWFQNDCPENFMNLHISHNKG